MYLQSHVRDTGEHAGVLLARRAMTLVRGALGKRVGAECARGMQQLFENEKQDARRAMWITPLASESTLYAC